MRVHKIAYRAIRDGTDDGICVKSDYDKAFLPAQPAISTWSRLIFHACHMNARDGLRLSAKRPDP